MRWTVLLKLVAKSAEHGTSYLARFLHPLCTGSPFVHKFGCKYGLEILTGLLLVDQISRWLLLDSFGRPLSK